MREAADADATRSLPPVRRSHAMPDGLAAKTLHGPGSSRTGHFSVALEPAIRLLTERKHELSLPVLDQQALDLRTKPLDDPPSVRAVPGRLERDGVGEEDVL